MTGFGETAAGVPAEPKPARLAELVDVTVEQYHADDVDTSPTLSASIAQLLINASPAHARAAHPKLNPTLEPAAGEEKFDLGTAAHALLLEGLEVAEVFNFDSWRTNEAKEARDTARAAGRIPMLAGQWDRVRAMVDAANRQLDADDITPRPFTNGTAEETIVFEMAGVLCRSRIDWIHRGGRYVADYKSTGASAHPADWAKTAIGIGADVQVAFHSAAVEAVFGERPRWRYVVQETYPPFALSVVEPDEEMIAMGRDKLDFALPLWARCMETGDWPGYPAGVHRISPPGWASAQWLGRDAA